MLSLLKHNLTDFSLCKFTLCFCILLCFSLSPPQICAFLQFSFFFSLGVLRPTQLYFVHKLLHFNHNTVVDKNLSLWARPFFLSLSLVAVEKALWLCYLNICLLLALFFPIFSLLVLFHISSHADTLTGMAFCFSLSF